MTIEQAIQEILSIRDFWLLPRHGDNGRGFEVRAAVDMAVAALRAQQSANDEQISKALRDNGFESFEQLLQAYQQMKTAQYEAEKNESPVCCKDCMHWAPLDALAGPSLGELERLGKCTWVRGSTMASEFCSRAEPRPPVKEEGRDG